MKRTSTALLGLAVGLTVLTGISGAADSATATTGGTHSHGRVAATPPTRGTITIRNYGFSGPGTLARGAVVTVRNRDDVTHTVTANSGHAFNVTVGPHASKTFRAPRKAGIYRFHCSIHTEMKGSLRTK